MSHEGILNTESEHGPEKILSREEVLSQLRSRCEDFELERELADTGGVYLLEVLSRDKTKRYIYQREGVFAGKIKSAGTTVRSEDIDDGYSRTIADYDPITGEWVDQ